MCSGAAALVRDCALSPAAERPSTKPAIGGSAHAGHDHPAGEHDLAGAAPMAANHPDRPESQMDDALARRLVGARLAQLAALPHFSRTASISI